MLLNESPYGAGIIPMYRTIQRVLRRSFRLIANVIPLQMILRRSFRFPNDRFGFNQKEEIQDHQEWFENNSTNKRWK